MYLAMAASGFCQEKCTTKAMVMLPLLLMMMMMMMLMMRVGIYMTLWKLVITWK
jgi:hypothetical protein